MTATTDTTSVTTSHTTKTTDQFSTTDTTTAITDPVHQSVVHITQTDVMTTGFKPTYVPNITTTGALPNAKDTYAITTTAPLPDKANKRGTTPHM